MRNFRFVANPCPIGNRKEGVTFVVANVRIGSQTLLFQIFGKKSLQCGVRRFISWNSYSARFTNNIGTNMGIVHQKTANADRLFPQSEARYAVEQLEIGRASCRERV